MSIPALRPDAKLPSAPFQHPVEIELQRVDDLLRAELSSVVRTVFAVSRHILDAGGKRMRPILVLLSARACGEDSDMERAVTIAAGVEMIHMATLMHDDVIDGAESRRGRKTANAFWGNQVSVLTGDYMLAKATYLLGRDGDVRIIRALSRATIAMTEGEIRQIESRGDAGALSEQYISIIRGKTAEFMSACCRIGAIIASAEPPIAEALTQYGGNLGFAFQITDDLLDLVGDPAETGKPIGGDIREGKFTIPLILAMERSSPADRMVLENIVLNEGASPADIEFVQKLIRETDAVEGTREIAAEYIKQAIESLDALPPSEHRDSLADLARYILRRKK
jgi:octaprenyl-diphosphate synthase